MPCIGHTYNKMYNDDQFSGEKTKPEQTLTLGLQFTKLHSTMSNILTKTF